MRRSVEIEDLSGLVRDALGARFRPVSVERLRGGTRKGVYRIDVDGPRASSVIVYSWAETENFWPRAEGLDGSDPFAPASGLAPFLAAQRRLDSLGVRAPRVLFVDDSRRRCPADLAVVEDVTGGSLEALFETDPTRAAGALRELGEMLDVLHQHHGPHHGRVDVLERGERAGGVTCEQLVLDRASRDLAQAARRDPRIGSAAAALGDRLGELAELVVPRTRHGLIHGELGPDHVLVDAYGHPVLIDIEGVMFFDVEWEHAFLQIRFGGRYEVLSRPGLDRSRLDLFMLAMRLSLVAGPLRLLDGDFPDRDSMLRIVEHNLEEALAWVR